MPTSGTKNQYVSKVMYGTFQERLDLQRYGRHRGRTKSICGASHQPCHRPPARQCRPGQILHRDR